MSGEFTYYLSGSGDEYGDLHPRPQPSVHRVSSRHRVEFWDPNDQTWNRSVLAGRGPLIEDLLESGAWVRQLRRDECARDVPNYDPEKFGG